MRILNKGISITPVLAIKTCVKKSITERFGNLSIRILVKATDNNENEEVAPQTFKLVINVNDAPTLKNAIANPTA